MLHQSPWLSIFEASAIQHAVGGKTIWFPCQTHLCFLTRECDSNERVIAVAGKNWLVPCLLTMAIVSYCGSLSQSGVCWSPYMEIHFVSVDPTEMHSDFGLRGFTLNIDLPENRLAECSVRFIYIQRAVLGCLFGDGRRTDELWVLTVWELFAIACTSKEIIANLIRLFGWWDRRRNALGNDSVQPLITAVVRCWWESLTLPVHNLGQRWLSWWVCCSLWSICNE